MNAGRLLARGVVEQEEHLEDLARSRWWSNRKLVAGLAMMLFAVLVVALGPVLYTTNPISINLSQTFLPPSMAHFLGTDELGRDILSRALAAGRLDLGLSAIAVAASLTTGAVIGTLAGYYGGWFDALAMRLVDVIIAFPFIVLIIAFVAVSGGGIFYVLVAFFTIAWTTYARLFRSQVLVIRQLDYVVAARGLGYSPLRILSRHVLPNAMMSPLVYSLSDVVSAILLIGSMSFLGLGVGPPTPEWGAMVAGGTIYLFDAWWVSTLPGIAILFVGVGLSLLGDGLAERIERLA